jgi:O-antigen/teichoic acid export membrane protein
MNNFLYKKLSRNASAQGFSFAITAFIQVISVPILLSSWGINLYGEWLILSTIPTYLMATDFGIGFGAGANNKLAMLIEKNKIKHAITTFQSFYLFTLLISGVSFLVLIFIAFLFPLGTWFHLKESSEFDFKLILIFLSLFSFLSLQLNIIEGAFRSNRRYATGISLLALLRLLESLVILCVALLGFKLIEASFFLFLTRTFGFLSLKKYLEWKYDWLTYGIKYASWSEIKELLSPAYSFIVFLLANVLNIQGIILLIGLILGPTSVTFYSILRTVSRFIIQINGLISNSFWPELSSAFARKNFHDVKNIYRLSSKLIFWLSFVMLIVLYFYGYQIINVWTKGKVQLNFTIFLMLIFTAIFHTFWYANYTLFASINKHRFFSFLYLGLSVLGFVLSGLLMHPFGIVGGAFGQFFSELIMLFYALPKGLNLVNEKFSKYINNLFRFSL